MTKFNAYCNACNGETKRDDEDPIYKGDCPPSESGTG